MTSPLFWYLKKLKLWFFNISSHSTKIFNYGKASIPVFMVFSLFFFGIGPEFLKNENFKMMCKNAPEFIVSGLYLKKIILLGSYPMTSPLWKIRIHHWIGDLLDELQLDSNRLCFVCCLYCGIKRSVAHSKDLDPCSLLFGSNIIVGYSRSDCICAFISSHHVTSSWFWICLCSTTLLPSLALTMFNVIVKWARGWAAIHINHHGHATCELSRGAHTT